MKGVMGVPQLLGLAAQVAAGLVLVVAAVSKMPATAALRGTLEALGASRQVAGPAALAVIGAELATGVGLIIGPAWPWPRVLVVLLAFGFAAAGVYAILLRRPISCAC